MKSIVGRVIPPNSRALLPPEAPPPANLRALPEARGQHGAKPKAQAVLGLGAWGKGVPRLGGVNTPVFFNF